MAFRQQVAVATLRPSLIAHRPHCAALRCGRLRGFTSLTQKSAQNGSYIFLEIRASFNSLKYNELKHRVFMEQKIKVYCPALGNGAPAKANKKGLSRHVMLNWFQHLFQKRFQNKFGMTKSLKF